jgi:putative spermidine/putrescine transport system substrate-binding protein
VHTARANGGSTENMEPGFQKMAELKPNIGYMHKGIGADVEDRVASGEFSIAIVEAHRPILAAEKGAPVRLDVPSEGAFALPFTLEVVANTPAKDLAEYYINIAFTPEAQRGFAEDGLFSPTLRGVQIPDSVKDKVVPTNKLLPFDWDILAANRPAWTERWNREVQP